MRIAIKFAYNGKDFYGYARQPKLKTVEGELIKSLVKNGFIEDTEKSFFRSASRTDKNVSALGNVVTFNTTVSKKRILSSLYNEDSSILIYGIKDVDPEFNPRYAKIRQYRYYLLANNLDLEKILSTSAYFTGTHNFSNYAKLESFKDPIRTIDNIIFTYKDEFLIIDFYAQTFLWHQIRRIISTIEKFYNEKLTKEQIENALENPEIKVDFGLAPAEPLILKDVIYDFEFDYKKNYLKGLDEFKKKIVSSLQN